MSNPASPSCAAVRVAPLPPLRHAEAGDGLGGAQRQLVIGAIVGLHLLAIWGLWQVQAVREAAAAAAPILVSLLPTPAAPTPPPPTPAPTPRPQPRARVQPAPPAPVIATPDSSAPEPVVAPLPQEAPPPAAPPTVPSVSVASSTPIAAPAPPPAPKQLPDDAVQYLQAPQLVYPPLSLRRAETGLVIVRAYIGTEGGSARSVQVERSSGHARLDQAAVAAVQRARFKPYAEKGQPVEGWALIPIRFELEK